MVVVAQEEARALGHGHIGTEHLLLGLLHEEEGIAAHVLGSFGVDLDTVRGLVIKEVGRGSEVPIGQIPFTPRAKRVLELTLQEAKGLGHSPIGSEHVLLGLVRENGGVAARILSGLDVDADRVRETTIGYLSG